MQSWNRGAFCASIMAVVGLSVACGASNVPASAPAPATLPAPTPPNAPSAIPKVNDACAAEQTLCRDNHTALFCHHGQLTAMSCAGPRGCTSAEHGTECDNTVAQAGDGCAEESDLACTPDARAELRCRNNRFTVASACRGPRGCSFQGNKLHCDTDFADPADLCEDKDDLACSLDKKTLYVCNGYRYEVEGNCRGPHGCQIMGTAVKCDHHVAEIGDVCRVAGNFACTVDTQAILVCKDRQFVFVKKCKTACTYVERGETTEFDCP